MKTILIILILMVSTITRASTQNETSDGYSISIHPDNAGNISLVNFNVPEEVYVKITVMENQNVVETLVEGEVDAGSHSVYCKLSQLHDNKNLVCLFEARKTENSDVSFVKKIEMK